MHAVQNSNSSFFYFQTHRINYGANPCSVLFHIGKGKWIEICLLFDGVIWKARNWPCFIPHTGQILDFYTKTKLFNHILMGRQIIRFF